MLRTYKELDVWRRSFQLCRAVYEISKQFPPDERFGPTAQIRRCAVSVPSNIAEGYSRGATKDYVRFLWIANGSLADLETQIIISGELGHADSSQCDEFLDEIGAIERMLRAMIRSLEGKDRSVPSSAN